MKHTLLLSILVAALGGADANLSAAENAPAKPAAAPTAAPASEAKTQLRALVGRIQEQMRQGKPTETSLAPYFKEFDALLEQHKAEKTADVAQILLMKGMLYLEVLENVDKGLAILGQLKTDFPETELGKNADTMIAQIKKGIESEKAAKAIQAKLVVGAAFPEFSAKDLDGKAVSVAKFKGKVLLIDFWATWCGPCVGEMPNVQKAYEKYHAKGFEIVGISLDRDEQALKKFIKDKNVPWTQCFEDGQKIATSYGVMSIPTTYLLNGEGKIVAQNLRGEALAAELGKLLDKP